MLLLVAQKVHLLGPSRSALARAGILTSLNNTRTKCRYAKMICNKREN